jgi:hypothetical protein
MGPIACFLVSADIERDKSTTPRKLTALLERRARAVELSGADGWHVCGSAPVVTISEGVAVPAAKWFLEERAAHGTVLDRQDLELKSVAQPATDAAYPGEQADWQCDRDRYSPDAADEADSGVVVTDVGCGEDVVVGTDLILRVRGVLPTHRSVSD